MKIALITDVHWGARNDSTAFIEFYQKFYEHCFFPTLEENGIDTIIMLGDTFDRRKYTNHNTIKAAKEIFFDPLKQKGITSYMIIGNHDTFFKNSNSVNSVELLLAEYDNIVSIPDPTTLTIGGTKIAMIPWICADNYAASFKEISDTTADICMGHLEIGGFEMYRGHPSEGGLSPDSFGKFDMVFSGHYHHRSTRGNITYLGTPYELTWQDYNDPKGFHIFDTETRELTFCQNPYTMFVRLEYNDKNQEPIDLAALDLRSTFVKLVVTNKTDFYKFDVFVNTLYNKGCHDVKIIEDMSEFQNGSVDETVDLEDTLSILSNYIDSVNTDIDKENIKTFMKSLFVEAINCETL